MADYVKYQLNVIHRASADGTIYLDEDFSARSKIETAADEVYNHLIEAALTTGSDLDLTHFASANYLTIHNLDGTNFITLTWDDANADTNHIVIAAGKFVVMPDVDPSATVNLTADTAACLCRVLVDGS